MRLHPWLLFALVPLLLSCGGTTTEAGERKDPPVGRLEVPEALHFGTVALGSRGERTLELRNAGDGELVVYEVTVPAPFEADVAFPATIAPGAMLPVPVAFVPVVPGPARAMALIRAGGREHRVTLTAEAGPSPLRCTPDRVDLGKPIVSAPTSFEIACTNGSAAAVTVAIEFDGPEVLTSSGTEPVQVAPGAEASFGFTFEASEPGPVSGAIRFVSGAAPLAKVPFSASVLATAVAVDVTACPGSLDVGFASPGATASRSFFVRNLAARPLRVTAATVEGPFTLDPAAPFEIPVDAPETDIREDRAEFLVTFIPTAAGPATGTVSLAFDDPGTPTATVCLSAYGGGPVLSCVPEMVDFGPVAVPAPRTELVTCTNTGTDVPGTDDDHLQFSSVTTEGPGFSVVDELLPGGLAPGEAATFEVTFAPTAGGEASGNLVLASNDPARPLLRLPLAATGLAFGPCQARIEPEFLDFGPVAAGGTPATLPVSIFNEGSEPCLVRDFFLAPGTSTAFSLPEGPPDVATVDPGEALTVPVRFVPSATETGSALGSLIFTLSVPAEPIQAIPMSGSTADPERECVLVFPESIDFGPVAPGCASPAAELLVVNRCDTPLELNFPTVLGAGTQFRWSTTAPTTLAVGGSITATVEYLPTEPGEHFAGWRWSRPGGRGSRFVPVHGQGALSTGVEVFPPASNRVDVLFVMQNSAALEEQAQSRAALPAFLGVADMWGIDWNFGVTTTGITVSGDCPGGAQGGEDGRLFPVDGSRPRIVRSTQTDAVTLAAANLAVGSCHYDEQGLEAAYRALTPPVIDHADDPRHLEPNDGNLGFLRPGARLAVIVLNQDGEQSPRSEEFYAAALGAVKRDPWSEPTFTGHAFTHLDHDGRLATFASAAHGLQFPISLSTTALDWTENFTTLGLAAFGRTHYFLKGRPSSVNDLQVLVDGRPWAAPASARSWDAAKNAVVIRPDAAPEPNRTVEIRYAPACQPAGN